MMRFILLCLLLVNLGLNTSCIPERERRRDALKSNVLSGDLLRLAAIYAVDRAFLPGTQVSIDLNFDVEQTFERFINRVFVPNFSGGPPFHVLSTVVEQRLGPSLTQNADVVLMDVAASDFPGNPFLYVNLVIKNPENLRGSRVLFTGAAVTIAGVQYPKSIGCSNSDCSDGNNYAIGYYPDGAFHGFIPSYSLNSFGLPQTRLEQTNGPTGFIPDHNFQNTRIEVYGQQDPATGEIIGFIEAKGIRYGEFTFLADPLNPRRAVIDLDFFSVPVP